MPNWKKIKHLRFDEVLVRSSQKLNAFAERRGLSSLSKLPTDGQFVALYNLQTFDDARSWAENVSQHFRSRTAPKFFSSLDSATVRNTIIGELQSRWPNAKSEIVERAERIIEGRFDLLGFHGLSFGEPVDWHLEPLSSKHTPLTHWSGVDYLDANLAGDKKIVWELNRHQYFSTLGQAYLLTGDERYARTFVAHLESWMDQNPPKLGINWASSLEVAFRSISWLWAFYFFKDSESFPPDVFVRALKFLYLHGRHLETYLSTYFSPNTHLTGEALGLFYLGTLLPEFKDAERWRQTGERILLEQLPIHVRPDGVYFEQSSYYHRYTVDFYIHYVILARANGASALNSVNDRLSSLLNHLMYITRPDGTTPLFGDDDGGRLVMLDRCAANDFRAALSTGASLFDRGDFKFVAGDLAEETLWLLGVEGMQRFDQIAAGEPAKQSVAFESGGYYVMRDGWTTTSNYLLFDCGPHGQANCGHAHADALSFELAANGRTLLVDPGTFTYTGAKELRNWFRSSSAHNTVTVDGESSSDSDGPFSWRTIAISRPVSWITKQRFDYVVAEHDGFGRLPEMATHRRSILFLKHNYWVLRDHIASSGPHQLRVWFHFDSGVAPLSSKGNEVNVLGENGHTTRLQLATFAPAGEWIREQGWVSSCYGGREEAPVFAFSILASGSEELVTFLLPQTTGAHPRPSVREIEAVAGRAFEIKIGEKLDVLLIHDPSEMASLAETGRLASDFELTWVRFGSEQARMPEELVLIGGQMLEFEGREILQSKERISYLSMSTHGDQVRRESEYDVVDLKLPVSDLESLFADLNPRRQARI
jgi:hypothetical protein